jgi:hypothetical protein
LRTQSLYARRFDGLRQGVAATFIDLTKDTP